MTHASTSPSLQFPPPAAPPRRRLLNTLLLISLTLLTLAVGRHARSLLWNNSEPFRFHDDINNAFAQGAAVLDQAQQKLPPTSSIPWPRFVHAYLTHYDRPLASTPLSKFGYHLDYPPGRLLIIALWVKHLRETHPADPAPPATRALPLLRLNTATELLAALAMFLLVRHWLRRDSPPNSTRPTTLAFLSATLLWLDPSLMLDAHAWPQWDAWILPFYLFAAFLASRQQWLAAGALLAFGAMFKGQLLCLAPLLLLWPLFRAQWKSALRLLIGFFSTTALLTSPWLLRTPSALWIVAGLLLATLATTLALARYPWINRTRPLLLLTVFAASVFLIGARYGGSYAWLTTGFVYGAQAWPILTAGPVNNLPHLLDARFGWTLHDTAFTLAHRYPISLRMLLWALYATGLTLCACALAQHDRRNDRRALLALVTPWILFFALMPQMHERYLLWASTLTACAAAISLGLTLLHLLLSVQASIQIGTILIAQSPNHFPKLHHALQAISSDLSWLTLLIAAIWLYATLLPPRLRSRA